MTTAAQRMPTADKPRRVVYPTRDGEPMAETDKHADLIIYVREALKIFFFGQPVYIASNNFVFWEQGNPKARIAPDVYAVFGIEMRQRDSYMAWQEGDRLPNVIFEFTSRKTQEEDVVKKLSLYEQVFQTPEYFLFDPTGDYLKPRLRGYRLEGGRYVQQEVMDERLHSDQLGLDLMQIGEDLRLFDPVRQEFLPTSLEQAQQAAAARLRAEQEARRADMEARRAAQAEAEVARLRAEMEALRNQRP